MLQHLRMSGALEGIAGAVFGSFEPSQAPDVPADRPLLELVREVFLPLGVPVVAGIPAGHLEGSGPSDRRSRAPRHPGRPPQALRDGAVTPAPRRVRLDLAYDGTDFAGWQVQPGLRTVQGVLEEALATIQGASARGSRAGRTDAGVHARGQVADAEVVTPASDARLLAALRSMLPGDVRLLALETADPSFHARHDAVSKTYRYLLDRSPGGIRFSSGTRCTIRTDGARRGRGRPSAAAGPAGLVRLRGGRLPRETGLAI